MDYYEQHGHNVSQTCRHFDIGCQTFYRWWHRYDPRRLQSLEDDRRTRRPTHVRQPQTPPAVEGRILALRESYPRWGDRKLAVLLGREGWTISHATIGRVLALCPRRSRISTSHHHAAQASMATRAGWDLSKELLHLLRVVVQPDADDLPFRRQDRDLRNSLVQIRPQSLPWSWSPFSESRGRPSESQPISGWIGEANALMTSVQCVDKIGRIIHNDGEREAQGEIQCRHNSWGKVLAAIPWHSGRARRNKPATGNRQVDIRLQ